MMVRMLEQLGWVLLNLTVLAAVVLLAWSVGAGLLLRLRLITEPHNSIERWHLPLAVGFGALSMTALGLGLVKLLSGPALVVACVGWVWVGRHGLLLLRSRSPVKGLPFLRDWGKFERLAMVLVGAHAALSWLGALAPPTYFDALVYHLGLPQLFLGQNHVWDLTGSVTSCFPLLVQMLNTFGLAWRCELFAGLLHWLFGCCAALLAYHIGALWCDRRVGLWAMIGLYATPLVNTLSGGPFVDLPFIWLGMLVVWTFLEWEQHGSRRALLLCALCGGLLFGVKANALLLLALLGLRAGWVWCTQHRDWATVWKFGQALLLMVGLVAIWPLYNWLTKGDPWCMFNAFQEVGWPHATPRLSWEDLFPLNWAGIQSVGGEVFYLLTALVRAVMRPDLLEGWRYSPGPAALLMVGWLAALPRIDRRIWWLVVLATVYSAGSSFAGLEASRYLALAYPCLAIVAGYVIWRLESEGLTRTARIYMTLVCGLAVINLGLLLGQQSVRLPASLGLQSREVFLKQRMESHPVMHYASTQLPSNSRVLTMDPRVYYLQADYLMGDPSYQVWLPWTQVSSAAALSRTLQERDVTHILVTWSYAEKDAQFQNRMGEGWRAFQKIWQTFGPIYTEVVIEHETAALYALKPSGLR